jgi:hypothetical protein
MNLYVSYAAKRNEAQEWVIGFEILLDQSAPKSPADVFKIVESIKKKQRNFDLDLVMPNFWSELPEDHTRIENDPT